MKFQTTAQEACYEKVVTWMQEIFGKCPCARQDIPGLGVFMGSALVEVLIFPWDEDDAIINTRSYVVVGAELKPDLMRYLLEENAKMIWIKAGSGASLNLLKTKQVDMIMVHAPAAVNQAIAEGWAVNRFIPMCVPRNSGNSAEYPEFRKMGTGRNRNAGRNAQSR